MADITSDSSHKDRLMINIRYVVNTNEGLVPLNQLLEMGVVLMKKTGEELDKKIVTALNYLGIPVKKIAFQSYDFTRNTYIYLELIMHKANIIRKIMTTNLICSM